MREDSDLARQASETEEGPPEHRHVVVSKRLVVVNAISSLVARFLNISVLLWTFQYLLNRIPVEEFAVYPVVVAIMVFAPLFFSFFTGGVSRYVVEAYAQGDFEQVGRIVSSIFPLLCGMSLVFLGAGAIFTAYIDQILTIAPNMIASAQLMMALLVVSFAVQMALLPFSAGFHVKQRFVELNLIGVMRDLLRIVLLLALLFGVSTSVVWVVVAGAVAELCHTLVVTYRGRQMVPELNLQKKYFSWTVATELVSFGLWTTIGQLGNIMYTNAATIVLNLSGTAVDVTSYYLGSTLFRQISATVGVAAQPLQPTLTAMHALNDKRRLRTTFMRGGTYALWASLAVGCPLLIFAQEFVDLYVGDKLRPAAMVIFLFMITFPFSQPTAMQAMTAMATKQVKPFFLAAFICQFIGLGLMIYFVAYRDMGAIGATLALTLIIVIPQIFYFWPLCFRTLDISLNTFTRRTLVPGLAPAMAGAIVWGGLRLTSAPDTWLSLALYVLAGAAAYAIILLRFCLDYDERTYLLSLLHKVTGSKGA